MGTADHPCKFATDTGHNRPDCTKPGSRIGRCPFYAFEAEQDCPGFKPREKEEVEREA